MEDQTLCLKVEALIWAQTDELWVQSGTSPFDTIENTSNLRMRASTQVKQADKI